MSFITVHVLRSLPMHNLNRDQNGMPKSQFDGGIQRGRLSSQAIKRPARIAFRDAVAHLGAPASIRTMDSNAAARVVTMAESFAAAGNKSFNTAAAKKTANAVVKGLAKKLKAGEAEEKSAEGKADSPEAVAEKKDNILLFSDAELETLALAIVEEQNGGSEATSNDFIQDFASPSLDVAAFGRMFAARADLSTQAAVAVSHAVMTHEMSLTIDYFTAVDEMDEDKTDSGAGHLGLAYYTSGVYYSTFTIDPAQLRRSWTGFGAPAAEDQLKALVKALVEALPTGKLTNTNAHTRPFLVLVENQRSRAVYEFETPVIQAENGGFTQPSIDALSRQYAMARTFDAGNYLNTVLYTSEATAEFAGAESAASIDDLTSHVASFVFANEQVSA